MLGGGSVAAEACTILNCPSDMVGLEAGEAVRWDMRKFCDVSPLLRPNST